MIMMLMTMMLMRGCMEKQNMFCLVVKLKELFYSGDFFEKFQKDIQGYQRIFPD